MIVAISFMSLIRKAIFKVTLYFLVYIKVHFKPLKLLMFISVSVLNPQKVFNAPPFSFTIYASYLKNRVLCFVLWFIS